jgi:RNA polymerase sigma-70 factor (ECF subfamily)
MPISSATTATTEALSEELIVRFRAGDERALELLWHRYLPRLKRWAHGRLPQASRGETATDDLIQDAFVRTLKRLQDIKLGQPGGLFAYFRTVVLNLVRDHARRHSRRPYSEEIQADEHLSSEPSPLEELIGTELLERYERARERLSEQDQQIIIAFVELRCTNQELAELFEKPSVDAARRARDRAFARLARAMSDLEQGVA